MLICLWNQRQNDVEICLSAKVFDVENLRAVSVCAIIYHYFEQLCKNYK